MALGALLTADASGAHWLLCQCLYCPHCRVLGMGLGQCPQSFNLWIIDALSALGVDVNEVGSDTLYLVHSLVPARIKVDPNPILSKTRHDALLNTISSRLHWGADKWNTRCPPWPPSYSVAADTVGSLPRIASHPERDPHPRYRRPQAGPDRAALPGPSEHCPYTWRNKRSWAPARPSSSPGVGPSLPWRPWH